MAGYVEREARINRHRHAQVNLCGDCGKEISATELLCRDCRHKPLIFDNETIIAYSSVTHGNPIG